MAAPAPAPVPPKDCGYIKAKGKRYNIKADVVRCRKARKVSRRYMTGGGSGRFSCQRYTGTNIKARCVKGKAIIYVIKR